MPSKRKELFSDFREFPFAYYSKNRQMAGFTKKGLITKWNAVIAFQSSIKG